MIRIRASSLRRVAFGLSLSCLPALAAEVDAPRYGQVVVPGGEVLRVELADTPSRRHRGYMYRERIGPEDGMLFVFPEDGIYPFWMKNTRISLDILWLAEDGTIVHVEPRVPPCREDPCESVWPMARARFVLEIPAGTAARLQLERGGGLEVLLPAGPGTGRER